MCLPFGQNLQLQLFALLIPMAGLMMMMMMMMMTTLFSFFTGLEFATGIT